MPLAASIKLALAAEYATSVDLGSVKHLLDYSPSHALADGTGANQASKMWTDQRTLAASASENLDLAGVLTDAFGTVLSFTKIKALLIRAASGNTNDVLVGGHGSAAVSSLFGDATDKVRVKPGGMVLLTAPDANGYAVTATTADMLTVANSAGSTSVTYDIVIIGV